VDGYQALVARCQGGKFDFELVNSIGYMQSVLSFGSGYVK
jgi:hypothetical protein